MKKMQIAEDCMPDCQRLSSARTRTRKSFSSFNPPLNRVSREHVPSIFFFISYQPEKHSIFCSKHFQRFLQGFCKYPATHKVIKYASIKCKPKRESFANVVQLC